MYISIIDIISEAKNEILKISMDIFEFYEKDIDKVHLTYSELKEIMIRLKQKSKKIFSVEDLLC